MEKYFWDRFCQLENAKGIKPHKALKEMNISNGLAHNWKNGTIHNCRILMKISTYFDISIDQLLKSNTNDDI